MKKGMASATMMNGQKRFEATLMEVGRTVSVLTILCAKQAIHVMNRLWRKAIDYNYSRSSVALLEPVKQAIATTKTKAAELLLYKKRFESKGDGKGTGCAGGLWQRNILMGEKCDPVNFSGAIFYDCKGNQVFELPPRSPRANQELRSFDVHASYDPYDQVFEMPPRSPRGNQGLRSFDIDDIDAYNKGFELPPRSPRAKQGLKSNMEA